LGIAGGGTCEVNASGYEWDRVRQGVSGRPVDVPVPRKRNCRGLGSIDEELAVVDAVMAARNVAIVGKV
jgi:hypothetical protein